MASSSHQSTARAILYAFLANLGITIQFGPDTMLAAKIRLRQDITIGEAVEKINELERALKSRVDNLRFSFIEPDTSD